MNELQIFQNQDFGDVRIIEEDGKFLFCGSDIAKALGYTKPHNAISEHCRYTLKRGIPHPQSPNKEIEMTFIPEGDVYRLISRSKLPAAQEFEAWVFDEVLPSLRKTGGYIAGEERMSDDELLSQALLVAQRKLEQRNAELAAAHAEIDAAQPKVIFADAVSAARSSILVGDLAKLLRQNGVEIGQRRLFEWLRANGYLMKSGESYNMPTQKSMERELFEIKVGTYINPDGSVRVTKTTKVSGKGQQYFINLFLAEQKKREGGNE